ncbi:MAG: DUF3995 domain-containing protein [Deltaproteobacteria bacterium]|nr:DUF3995 domain-containing protein [Deltaproteobacteria bacterium]
MLRGHLAWPLFVVAAAAAAIAGGWLGGPGLVGVSFTAAAALCAVGVLHLLWAVGLRAGMDAALPTDDNGTLLLRPPSWLTAMVAFALLTTATAFAALASGVELFGLHAVVIAATVVFGVRAAGDGRYVGFTKTHRTSRFGRLDDLLYTPLSVLFALGGTAALLV